jgi:GNAT superfamily N-acetyltransferase
MGFTITDASPTDAAPLARILGDWVRETGWMPILHSRDEDRAFLAGLIGTHRVRVARHEGAALGFLADRRGQIDALYLGPAARGKGIGKALLDEVKDREPEVGLWTFQANTRAVSFYLRAGFVEAERTDGQGNDERLPDIRMIWRRAS